MPELSMLGKHLGIFHFECAAPKCQVVAIHGGLDQEERHEAIRSFKEGSKDCLAPAAQMPLLLRVRA